MKPISRRFCRSLCVIIVLRFTVCSSFAQIPSDDLAKIEAALPAKATAAPQHPRKLLVFTLTEGYKHASIPYAAKALELMGQKTGAFTTTVSEDMASFNESNRKQYDAVCFVSTTELKFADTKLRESLLKFVKSGKGVIGIHAASDNFYDWPEAAEMMGGLFDGHPWNANGAWAMKIDDPQHPLAAAFKGAGFILSDEIYRHKAPISREYLRVLVSLDLAAEGNMQVEGLRTSDIDIPISWVRNFGKGRVFYCSLGHNNSVYWNAAVLQHYLDGIQFALGDLQADATPSIATCLAAVAKYDYGQSRGRLTELDNFIRVSRSSPAALARLEKNFITILSSPNATLAGKQYVCEHLSTMGTGASVPTLAKLLNNSETIEIARFALERIPHEAAAAALRNALPKATGSAQIGIVTSLGQRRDAESVALLSGLMKSAEARIAHAAIAALGAIANADAARALDAARRNASGEELYRIAEARLQCAEAFATASNKNDAMLIYLQLNAEPYPAPIRFAALRGQIKTEPENAAGRILALLKTQNAETQARAIRLVHEIPSTQNMSAIVNALPSLPALQQVQLITALGSRREAVVRDAITQATKSEAEEVRLAALKALAQVGDASSVLVLAEAAAKKGAEGEAARASLNSLRGENLDAAIVSQLATSAAAIKVELIRSTETRRITAATSALLQAARDNDEAVRLASLKALRTTASAEHERVLLDFLIQTESEDERNELEKTVAAVAQKNPDADTRNAAILALLPNVKQIEAKASLLHVLGKIGESSALPELRAALAGKQPELRLAAIRALSDWPNATPQDDLLKIAQTSRDQTEKILALRGFVRLLGLPSARSSTETLALYQTALQLAPNLDEQRMVLSGLSQQKGVDALMMATRYLSDATLNAEATAAVLKISETTSRTAPLQTKPVLQQIMKGENEAWRTQAQNLLKGIERLEDFIMAWEVSGPYVGKDVSLFECAFPPEENEGVWSKAEYAIDPQQPWLVPLDKMLGGESRVAYLRAKIWSDKAQPARLELGSDDGVKAWLNGALVHGNNASRGVNPGDDRVAVNLKTGENVLLLKIIQGAGGWGACARVRGVAGEHLAGVRVVE